MLAVDDGSTDDSPALLRRLAVSRPWLRVLRLRRNFGQSAAFDAGFQAARGKLVVTLDAESNPACSTATDPDDTDGTVALPAKDLNPKTEF